MQADSQFYIFLIDSIKDAIKDTFEIIPFLFLIFIVIEIIEHFYSDKILASVKFSRKSDGFSGFAPILGAFLAAIPQCGLSVIASTLYCKRIISKGTLIAVYLATSDEAIPVLISNPQGYKIVLPLIVIKIVAGFLAGYLIDIVLPSKTFSENFEADIHIEKGCHSHNISSKNKKETIKELLFHPVVHTLSVAFFVFLITVIINLIFTYFVHYPLSFINLAIFHNQFIEPCLAAIFGIIPNCAVSVGITIMYLKGAISFASCVSGLCAGAGLGILVLIKNNDNKKDTINIILLLLIISILTGIITALSGYFMWL